MNPFIYALFITFVISLVLSNQQRSDAKLRKQTGFKFATIILMGIVAFLAVDIGYALYNPGQVSFTLPFGTLKIIGGDIQVQTKDSLTWEEGRDGMPLEPGSRVRTAPDSCAMINFAEGTTTKLEPGTDVIITRLENNRDNQLDTITLKQQSGKTWNQVAKKVDDSYDFQIKTAAADIIVHGTSFATEVDKSGTTTVQTTEGDVSVSAEGQEVHVPGGQQTRVEAGLPPAAPEPMPPATNELVLTINKPAIGLIVDPSGSSAGYSGDGSQVNQIAGSKLSLPEEEFQTVRIPEPTAGEYTIKLYGVAGGDAYFNIEGYAEGENTFSYTESGNITTANEYVLQLHIDVLDGLLGKATVAKAVPSDNQARPVATAATPEAGNITMPDVSSQEEAPNRKEGWLSTGNSPIANIWAGVTVLVLVMAGVLVAVWRRI
jgi:hypothetical protein